MYSFLEMKHRSRRRGARDRFIFSLQQSDSFGSGLKDNGRLGATGRTFHFIIHCGFDSAGFFRDACGTVCSSSAIQVP